METKEKQRYYEKLYRETRASIEQYLRCLLHNSSAVEDVIQEVYLEAYRKLDVLEQHPEPRGFLFRVARNKALHWIRDKNRIDRAEVLCEDTVLATKEYEGDVYEEADIRTTVQSVLTAEEYRLFDAHYICGYTEKEIATARQKSPASVRMHYCRMVKKLRKSIRDAGL